MTFDLEKLIRERQDELRGRPEDWIDRFVGWHRRQDWVLWATVAVAVVAVLLLLTGAGRVR